MSHVCKLELEIKDLEVLARAAKRIGLEFVPDQKTYRWYGRSVGDYPVPQGFVASDLGKCLHAIRVPGSPSAYEAGVVERRDGKQGYTLLFDFWRGGYGLEEKLGKNGDHLKNAYATEFSKKYWQRQGYRVSESVKEDGSVVLQATR